MAKRGRPATEIMLTGNERRQLESWARRHSSSQALAMRCKIVLAYADPAGLRGRQIAGRVGCNPATVSKWRRRFAEHRLDGLIDEPRPGAQRTISDETVEQNRDRHARNNAAGCDALVDAVAGGASWNLASDGVGDLAGVRVEALAAR